MRQAQSDERGQTSVEMVAVLPFLMLAALVAWQFVMVGHVAWSAAGAARAGARAAVVGRDAARAARSALPRSLARETRVVSAPGGGVRVSVPIPLVVHAWRSPLRVSATASLR